MLSELQYKVIGLIGVEAVVGRELRKMLAADGVKKSGPAFYQLTARMEEAGLIESSLSAKLIDGIPLKEKTYWVTGEGAKQFKETRSDYKSKFIFGKGVFA
ncbi:hypothetical protein [Rubellicoccus peritrichatus]|uniref:PadR family transcriptional regulator n=1 Tax=Rubellicoccus peritrichatus TaxID=3080537 RepID=A0AAQ3LD05_9BACT|nr:hypothetical protein [Puniceicoccus sp. CR14]WOO43122.1 hypothetical protein RZN69_08455 [Puniceicoccus sp. CR14]